MGANAGRKIVLTWNGEAIPGAREKGVNLNGEAIDVTDDDSNGVRQLLEESAEDQVDISISGVSKSQLLMKAWFDGRTTPAARMGAVTVTYPDGRVIGGTYRLNTYSETGAYNDAVTFECELQSSGEFTYTAGA